MRTGLFYLAAAASLASLVRADVAGVVGRSDLILERANTKPEEAMPLGNGRLGAAIWSSDGMTIQLNRSDTLPRRLSPGQVVLPGLAALTKKADYKGRVDLYNGEFRESGGGIKAAVWLEKSLDVMVVDVQGVPPNAQQTILLRLWSPRRAKLEHGTGTAVLSETWKDENLPGSTGETFGSLASITVKARSVQFSRHGPLEGALSFVPEADGSFRLWIAAPKWTGGNALAFAESVFTKARAIPENEHRIWWNHFWQSAALMKLESADHAAEYFENLRAINLFLSAAESSDTFPGSQAGVADLFSSARDFHQWDPSAYWHWNLRMYVAANLGAGVSDLNAPYFRLYRNNLANIERWTRERMENRPGICIPETMRFNGVGFEYETWTKAPGRVCDAGSPPYYNARTLSTGAEVSLWIWEQYQMTDDRAFLAENYPVMTASARFLLAYAKLGDDRLLHTFPSNAHETQWDVHDPITDISAMKAFFPAFVEASRILGRDADLASEVRKALTKIRPLPIDGAKGDDVLGMSYDPRAEIHNSENLGLEAVWPYKLIGVGDPLAIRTYQRRPNKFQNDWSYDALHAAHLGLPDEMKTALSQTTEKYQAYPSGLAHFVGPESYREQIAVVAASLQDALSHEFAGVVEVAPAWPVDWNVAGSVALSHNSSIFIRVQSGKPQSVIFKAGYSGILRFRMRGAAVTPRTVNRGQSYDLLTSSSAASIPALQGQPAEHPKRLGTRSIGLLR